MAKKLKMELKVQAPSEKKRAEESLEKRLEEAAKNVKEMQEWLDKEERLSESQLRKRITI